MLRPPGPRLGFGGPGVLPGTRLALRVAARARGPFRYPYAQRLVAPDDRFDWLSAHGTGVRVAVHTPRLERQAAQRLRWYVRTTTPLPKVRTESGTNAETSKPEPNIGMPVPSTTG
uniref:Uncharacterized protein n=1 Tax=Streptomyces coelicolor TaxID=1902 RepID=O51922_STRCH|nr:unknown [Streptomyces coelicolor]